METQRILELYDGTYAAAYDERFIFDQDYLPCARFEVEVLGHLLQASDSWLDAACGTGYFLSQFPGAARAGFDLSASMLKVARGKNPDAQFLEEGDFRSEYPEWTGKWDLVSCMWCAYTYVESVTEINRVIRNLARWTSSGGACFLPLCDLEDVLTSRQNLPRCIPDIEIFGGPTYVNAVVWSYVDTKHKKRHENLVSPHIELLIDLFRETFSRVEIIYYPPYPRSIPGQRKALIATGKQGAVSSQMEAALQAILKKSQEHLSNVQTIADLQAAEARRLQPKPAPPPPSRRGGWLRRAWRKLPPEARRLVKAVFGES